MMAKTITILLLLFTLSIAEVITPIPLNVEYDKRKAELGKKLFFDTILSKDGTISCAVCHNLPGSGADSTPFSFGIDGEESEINSPTVLNSAYNFRQFWDGRVRDLKEQAISPIINPKEMGDTVENVLKKLNDSPYKKEFDTIYKDGVSKDNLADVIAEFEKALTTPNSRFDKYLRGDEKALNEQEKRGFKAFKDIGCISCHNGRNIGGNMFQKVGVIVEYEESREHNGRFNVTKRERDKKVFKVPTLRNIELTAPYFHDGKLNSLEEAVADMQEHQLGIVTDAKIIEDIVAFLRTLTGEMPHILKEAQ